jgi:hypothetical protein
MFVNEGHASGGVPIMVNTVGSETGSAESVTAEFLVNDYLGTTLAGVGAEDSAQVEGTLVAGLGAGGDAAADRTAGARFTGKPYDADLGISGLHGEPSL